MSSVEKAISMPGEALASDLAALCKASADPLRLQVLRVLREDSFGVSELCSIFDIRQPALSHHLKVLAGAGLVATRREGNAIFYRRAQLGQRPELEALQAALFESVDQIELPEQTQLALSELHVQREANSRNFFRDNAHKFRQQQDLIASYEQYAGTVAEVLRNAPLTHRGTALEVGPGDGSFLLELAPQFDRVVALDIEAMMLEQARQKTQAAGADNIEFIHGDTASDALEGLQADCAVINMVLHHTPAPGQILKDVAARLAPGGAVLVTDLCAHDQGWARENCGDLWLGFDPAQLTEWASDAGLTDLASAYLAQRNGFQVQVRLFGHPG
ncbi:ArsR family transcriptional regulator [Halioglobus japonicus]|uniref:Methyltransferase domain-containing protein n=1 Tax=Halioglobus japonicus TaxID=930805 RepID=A0AAP8MCY7_9GAMM|nr:metalloregulator ArsR/SmtB family transcription factor [Halioglobus japonicus]AQA17434.1 ArsR family transcriptional regulator [Halioglobus japonicus]PLW85359.1 methyltransferase domain-containing protein [Halioglobus japonicus]